MNPEQQPTPTPQPPQQNGWNPLPQQPTPTPVVPSAFNSQASTSPNDTLGEGYLNEIAAKEPIRVHKFAIIGIIGGILVLLIVILSIMMNSGGPNVSTQAKFINGRVATLKTITSAQQKHLGDNTLSATNATLSSLLTSISSDLSETMKAKKISITATGTTEKTYATALTKKLDDAYQRGTLDRTYAPQLSYELSLLRSKLVALKNSGSSTSISDFCTRTLKNLDVIIATLKSFSSTS